MPQVKSKGHLWTKVPAACGDALLKVHRFGCEPHPPKTPSQKPAGYGLPMYLGHCSPPSGHVKLRVTTKEGSLRSGCEEERESSQEKLGGKRPEHQGWRRKASGAQCIQSAGSRARRPRAGARVGTVLSGSEKSPFLPVPLPRLHTHLISCQHTESHSAAGRELEIHLPAAAQKGNQGF